MTTNLSSKYTRGEFWSLQRLQNLSINAGGTSMKIKEFTINRNKSHSIEIVDAGISNKIDPTAELIIANMSQVLLDIFQQQHVKKMVVAEDE